MNVNNLHQIRFEAVKEELQYLNKSIEDLSSTLTKKQEEYDDTKNKQKSNSKIETETETTKKEGEYLNWTHIYDKCNNWVDTDEIQSQMKKSKQKFSKLKKNHEMTSKGRNIKKESLCCSSQNRGAEVKVIKMTTRERLKHMQSFRCDHGNLEYKKGNYLEALKWYDKSLIYYEYCFMSSGGEKEKVENERMLCLLNMAACNLALNKYEECIKNCCEVLEMPKVPNNHKGIKALFRRAQAYRFTYRFEQAQVDLEQAKSMMTKLDDNSHPTSLDDEFHVLTCAIKKYQSNSKEIAKRMMKEN